MSGAAGGAMQRRRALECRELAWARQVRRQGERVRGRAEWAQILAALEQVARASNGARASGAAAVAWQRANRRRAV
jgi:hypothetical protein